MKKANVVCLAMVACVSACGLLDTPGEGDTNANAGTNSNSGTGGIDFGETSGDVEFVEPPVSVVPGETESDNILVFREREAYSLPTDLTIEADEAGLYDATSTLSESTLSSGTSVDSFYVHVDHPESSRQQKTGSVTFDRDILGLVITSDAMVAANDVLAVSELSTEYPTASGQEFGLELDSEDDSVEIDADGRTLLLDVSTGSKSDSLRVILPAE